MLNLHDYEAAARALLRREIYDFFAGGACDEITAGDNVRAYQRMPLRYRVLRGGGTADLGQTVLGETLQMPVVIAPTAFHRLAHPEGELATARAAARAGCLMITSSAATTAVEDVVAAARSTGADAPPIWFQLYLQPDRGVTAELVDRAEEAGCSGLVWTVDSPAFGRRERDLRNRFVDLPDGLLCANMVPRGAGGQRRPRDIEFDPGLSWDDLDWLRSATDLPIVLKGIVHPQDARMAVSRGADGIIVSNHGGRQLDTTAASIDLLPAVVAAVEGRIPVLVDGGIRRGTDVVKALAVGACAVGLGRPILWGLAVDGEEGVAAVLELLRDELALAMVLCGCSSVAEVTRDVLFFGPGVAP
ncbi:MAG: alpha-hydroxy-acid oxidizing protein [Proteobacteria bacterium]|nr:alpha-hydroxy-acid oxidizing protein [Pseudomonadota bacterium]